MLTIVENYEIYQRRTVEQTPIRRFARDKEVSDKDKT